MKITLPTPKSLETRRAEIKAREAEELKATIDQFCTDVLTNMITAANEKKETETYFALPKEITYQQFMDYIVELNMSIGGDLQYSLFMDSRGNTKISWGKIV